MDTVYCFLSLVAFVGLWFLNSKIIIPRMIEPIRQWPYTKFEKCDPMLGTINGIGCSLYGGWGRYDPGTNSTAYYLFFSFIIPLIPLGCYRATQVGEDGNNTQYQIYGHDKWRFWEIFAVYISSISWVGGIISLLFLIVSIFD
jgi:hypothetical protein